MRTLAIDCATEACSVALFDGSSLVAGDFRMLGRGHAEALVPMIAALPERGRADRIAVSLGPGSFTGLRVGIAAARALALAWKVPASGFPTLDLVAAMVREQQGARPLCVAMTGGHGEWFVQGFAANGTTTRPLASLRPEEAARACDEECVAGTQAEALVTMRGSGTALATWPDARALPLLLQDAWREDLSPIYGRAPDAKLPGAA